MKSLLKFIQIHRSVKRHATIFSIVVVVMLFGLFMEAYMHNFNLVYITLFFVFSLAFTAGPLGVLNIVNLKGNFLLGGRFFAKEEGAIPLRITNTSSTASWSILIYGQDTSIPLTHIKGNTAQTVKLPFTPTKRGRFVYEGCYLESRYPLSTARFTRSIKDSYEGLAYPEPKGKSLEAFLNEEETYHGEEKEFDGLQNYDGTQKLSHIHWASVAKGEMAVKLFSKETQVPNLTFRFVDSGSDTESRLSQLCLWVLECEKRKLPFTVYLPNKRLSSTKESIDEILEALARY